MSRSLTDPGIGISSAPEPSAPDWSGFVCVRTERSDDLGGYCSNDGNTKYKTQSKMYKRRCPDDAAYCLVSV